VHDLVKGVEDLCTTLQTALDIEKALRGITAGFHTPTFVVDAPGGGGKRGPQLRAPRSRHPHLGVRRAVGESGTGDERAD